MMRKGLIVDETKFFQHVAWGGKLSPEETIALVWECSLFELE